MADDIIIHSRGPNIELLELDVTFVESMYYNKVVLK